MEPICNYQEKKDILNSKDILRSKFNPNYGDKQNLKLNEQSAFLKKGDILNSFGILREKFNQNFEIKQNIKPNEASEKNKNPIGVTLPLKEINISAHINRLKKINMNKKNHKKKKIRAINQYNPPQNIQFNPNPINYPKFPIPYSQNRNNRSEEHTSELQSR